MTAFSNRRSINSSKLKLSLGAILIVCSIVSIVRGIYQQTMFEQDFDRCQQSIISTLEKYKAPDPVKQTLKCLNNFEVYEAPRRLEDWMQTPGYPTIKAAVQRLDERLDPVTNEFIIHKVSYLQALPLNEDSNKVVLFQVVMPILAVCLGGWLVLKGEYELDI